MRYAVPEDVSAPVVESIHTSPAVPEFVRAVHRYALDIRAESTPKQKGLLQSLSRETGKDISSLITEALEGLQKHVRPGRSDDNGSDTGDAQTPAARPKETRKPIWEIANELFGDIPEEELEQLPVDGAAQHDHYIYGLPKRPA